MNHNWWLIFYNITEYASIFIHRIYSNFNGELSVFFSWNFSLFIALPRFDHHLCQNQFFRNFFVIWQLSNQPMPCWSEIRLSSRKYKKSLAAYFGIKLNPVNKENLIGDTGTHHERESFSTRFNLRSLDPYNKGPLLRVSLILLFLTRDKSRKH